MWCLDTLYLSWTQGQTSDGSGKPSLLSVSVHRQLGEQELRYPGRARCRCRRRSYTLSKAVAPHAKLFGCEWNGRTARQQLSESKQAVIKETMAGRVTGQMRFRTGKRKFDLECCEDMQINHNLKTVGLVFRRVMSRPTTSNKLMSKTVSV
jgi:hypothetical protein